MGACGCKRSEPLPRRALPKGRKKMRKACLYLSPLERLYIDIYKESPEITLMKYGSEVLQERMDEVYRTARERHFKELKEECPFLT